MADEAKSKPALNPPPTFEQVMALKERADVRSAIIKWAASLDRFLAERTKGGGDE
jgi:hypothetical protein